MGGRVCAFGGGWGGAEMAAAAPRVRAHVTGFGPFGGVEANPTQAVAEALREGERVRADWHGCVWSHARACTTCSALTRIAPMCAHARVQSSADEEACCALASVDVLDVDARACTEWATRSVGEACVSEPDAAHVW